MAKNKISEWSSTAANNTDIGGIDIAEGCAPSGINNAIRELMAQVKDQQAGTDGDNLTVGGNLIVNGTTTLTGTPTAPTAASGTNTTQIATTAFVTSSQGTMASQNASAVAITGGTVAATITATTASTVNSLTIGYRDIPQVAKSTTYTLVLTDEGKHIYYTGAAATLTVPTNASVAFPTGTAITIINNGTGNLTIGTTSLTVYYAGTTLTGNRTLSTKGMATIVKVATDTWFISGAGLS